MVSRRQFLTGRLIPPPAANKARISEHCLSQLRVVCRACGEACDAGAIRFSPVVGGAAVPLIDLDACTGCGDCVGVCPQAAIRVAAPTRIPA